MSLDYFNSIPHSLIQGCLKDVMNLKIHEPNSPVFRILSASVLNGAFIVNFQLGHAMGKPVLRTNRDLLIWASHGCRHYLYKIVNVYSNPVIIAPLRDFVTPSFRDSVTAKLKCILLNNFYVCDPTSMKLIQPH